MSNLEQELGIDDNTSPEEFDEKIDKYLVSLYNKKNDLSNKEFTEKVLEIYQTTDWNNEASLPSAEIDQDLNFYEITFYEYEDVNMPILSCTAYRYMMHYFNDILTKKYTELITNKEEWIYEFEEHGLNYEVIDDWKNSQIFYKLREHQDRYIEEKHKEIINSLDLSLIHI